MTSEELSKIQDVPPEVQKEIYDFIEFMVYKYGKKGYRL